MQWKKLNYDYDAEPNGPSAHVSVANRNLDLDFFLNHYLWPNLRPEARGRLTFNEVWQYRLGSTNDEGFYRGQCRYSASGIPWGDFYELYDSDWRNTFPNDRICVASDLMNDHELRHFLFYLRDETFECIAKAYSFTMLSNSVSNPPAR